MVFSLLVLHQSYDYNDNNNYNNDNNNNNNYDNDNDHDLDHDHNDNNNYYYDDGDSGGDEDGDDDDNNGKNVDFIKLLFLSIKHLTNVTHNYGAQLCIIMIPNSSVVYIFRILARIAAANTILYGEVGRICIHWICLYG